jgi:hypothetical protein
MFQEALAKWQPYKGLSGLPPSPVQLWTDGGRGIWIADSWGPAVPYPAVVHEDGSRNFGYVRVKGDPEAVKRIPEVQGYPELQDFLLAVNVPQSPIESVGCEKGFFPSDVEGLTVKLGSYIDVILSEPVLNVPENLLLLASLLLPSVSGCEKWWSNVELSLQPMRFLGGVVAPWGLMVRVTGYGRSEDEARKWWGETMVRLTRAVGKLPPDLRAP